MKRRLWIILLIAVAVAGVSIASFLTFNTALRAEYLTRRHLVEVGTDHIGKYDFHATRLGESSWRVSYGQKGVPLPPSYYLVDARGTATPMSADALSRIMREEFHPHRSDADHEDFIRKFILHLHSESFEIIGSPFDIPGYEVSAQRDQEALPISPRHVTENGTHIFFTYQQIGGVVRRYEFHYDSGGAFTHATATKLGHGIGTALYYE